MHSVAERMLHKALHEAGTPGGKAGQAGTPGKAGKPAAVLLQPGAEQLELFLEVGKCSKEERLEWSSMDRMGEYNALE